MEFSLLPLGRDILCGCPLFFSHDLRGTACLLESTDRIPAFFNICAPIRRPPLLRICRLPQNVDFILRFCSRCGFFISFVLQRTRGRAHTSPFRFPPFWVIRYVPWFSAAPQSFLTRWLERLPSLSFERAYIRSDRTISPNSPGRLSVFKHRPSQSPGEL